MKLSKPEKDSILHCCKNPCTAIFSNNLQLQSACDEQLYEMMWRHLQHGKVNIISRESNQFVPNIQFVKIDDVSGKQEYYCHVGGGIILSKVITLGE